MRLSPLEFIMRSFFLVLHIVVTLLLVSVILLNKNQEEGSFSSDRSTAVRGQRSGSDPITKVIAALVVLFFGCSLMNTWIAKNQHTKIEGLLKNSNNAL